MNPTAKDPLQRKIEINNWIVLTAVLLPSLLCGVKFALGVLLGGFICIVNFYWMAHSLRAAFHRKSGNIKANVVLKYFLRLFLTGVVLYFLISARTVNVIGLILGLSVVVVTVVLTVWITLSKKNLIEESF